MKPRVVNRQFRMYTNRLWWIARDSIPHYWGSVLLIIAINLFGVMTAMVTLGGAFLYAKHLEHGDPAFAVAGIDLSFVQTTTGFVLYAFGLMVAGIASALALYMSDWYITRVTVKYQHRLITSVLDIAADADCTGWQLLLDDSPKSAIGHLIGTRSKLTALAFRNMLRAILPVITFVIATVVLVSVDWVLTILIAPIVLVWLVPLYLINRGVARLQRQYTVVSREANKALKGELSELLEPSDPQDDLRMRAGHALDDPLHNRAGTMYWQRKFAIRRVQVANTILFVVCLIGLFLLFGIETKTGDRTWSGFIAFIIALRFTLSGIRKTTARFVKLSRYLPEFVAYTQFIDDARDIRAMRQTATPRPLPDSIPISLAGARGWDSPRRVKFIRGRCVWVISNMRPTSAVLRGFAALLEQRAKDNCVDLVSHGEFISGDPPEQFQGDVVFARASIFNNSGLEHLDRLQPDLDDRFLILITNDVDLPLDERFSEAVGPANAVIVTNGWEVIGGGNMDWLQDNLDEIRETIVPVASAESDQAFDYDNDDDDDDDDDDM